MKKYCTTYTKRYKDGTEKHFCGEVFANNATEAQDIADAMKLGVVEGQMCGVVDDSTGEERFYDNNGNEITYAQWFNMPVDKEWEPPNILGIKPDDIRKLDTHILTCLRFWVTCELSKRKIVETQAEPEEGL